MTDTEKLLWSRVRHKQLKGLQFYRQRIIIGNYLVDFYCPKAKLIVEIDGGQHYTDKGQHSDRIRDEYVSSLGLNVLRFSDTEVLQNKEDVLQQV